MAHDLDRLFEPRTVAVVGATESPGKPGRRVTEQLLQSPIRCYPVNPRRATVLGATAYRSIKEIPEPVDLAVVAVAAASAIDAVEECVARGVPFVVVLAGGFAEAGERGAELQARLAATVRGSRTRLLGPNTLGLQVPASGLDTVFVDHATNELASSDGRGVTLVSQSGSVAVEALGAAAVHGLPLRAFAGLGNGVDLGAIEFVEHAGVDPLATSLALYLEHAGEGRPFLDAAARASERVPVFVLKSGRTSAGAAAVASHTGRLAGSDRVMSGAFAQCGLQRVVDDEELTDAVRAVTYARIPAGNRVAIVTSAGGYGVMGADAISEPAGARSLELAELAPETERAVRAATLPFASARNPVDVTAGADDAQFLEAVQAVLADPSVDIAIVYAFFAPPGITDDLVGRIAVLAEQSAKSLLVLAHAGTATDEYCRRFTLRGVAAYPSLARVVRAARLLVERAAIERRNRVRSAPGVSRPAARVPARKAAEWLRTVGGRIPTEADAKDLLDRYAIATPPRTRYGPNQAIERPPFDGPYAVKVASAGIVHKTDLDALRLEVPAEGLPEAADGLRRRFPDAELIVEQMVTGIRVELIAGATRDPDLGPALMLGAGGVLTELYRDVAFRLVPAAPEDLASMLDELTVAALVRGFRGRSADRAGLLRVLGRLSALVCDLGERFAELDVNPICYAGEAWIAVDAKVVLRSP